MKRIILLFTILLVLCGCNQKPKTIVESNYDIVSTTVDMSGYFGVNSTNHCFRLVTCQELFNTIDNKGSGVFYLGRTNCQCCLDVTKYLDEVARELNVTVYYIDVYNPQEDLGSNKELQDKLKDYMYDICALDDEGEKAIYTPHLFQVINGELGENQICHDNIYYNDPTDAQINKLKDVYRNILKPFSCVE